MENNEWVVLILGSTVIGSVISGIVGYRLASINYKRSYYSMILTKRIEAYNLVHDIISNLNLRVHLGEGRTCHLFLANGNEQFTAYCLKLSTLSHLSFWLSIELDSYLQDLFHFLSHKVANVKRDNIDESFDFQLKEAGIKYETDIRNYKNHIESQFRADIMNLYDIKKFLKLKNQNKTQKWIEVI